MLLSDFNHKRRDYIVFTLLEIYPSQYSIFNSLSLSLYYRFDSNIACHYLGIRNISWREGILPIIILLHSELLINQRSNQLISLEHKYLILILSCDIFARYFLSGQCRIQLYSLTNISNVGYEISLVSFAFKLSFNC